MMVILLLLLLLLEMVVLVPVLLPLGVRMIRPRRAASERALRSEIWRGLGWARGWETGLSIRAGTTTMIVTRRASTRSPA